MDRILRWMVPRSSSSHDWVRCIVIPMGGGGEGGEGREGKRGRGRRGYCYKSHTVIDTPHLSESFEMPTNSMCYVIYNECYLKRV